MITSRSPDAAFYWTAWNSTRYTRVPSSMGTAVLYCSQLGRYMARPEVALILLTDISARPRLVYVRANKSSAWSVTEARHGLTASARYMAGYQE